jgi:hypothetical protein
MKIDRLPWRTRGLHGLAVALLLVAGCGGGVGTGGTGGYAQGPINGFGSVIVNDVRYDDSAALVFDADGGTRSRDDLRLGMVVDIESGAVSDGGSGPAASASRIRYASEMVGPVAAVDSANGRFTLLGQPVQVATTTVFDDSLAGGLGAITAGSLLEVYGAFDPASGAYQATRVEPRSSAASYRLRGVVSQLDTVTRRFRIGGAEFDYGSAAAVPAALANGSFVRLLLQPAAAGSSRWTVQAFASAPAAPGEGLQAKFKGLISAFTSSSDFFVNGQRIDASSASFPDGSAGLALGVRVEVEGSVRGGVLRAAKVSIESDDEEQTHGFELHGSISLLSTVAKTFVVRGVVVSYAGTVEYRNGGEAQLLNGARVEIKGVLAAGGNVVQATRIEFDN